MKAVILAGGLGMRLRPFTQAIPKPLLPIGEQSLMELQIRNLARDGFEEIFISTNYKAEYVEHFVGDGVRMGARVTFSKETTPLGTCGPLSLLRTELTEPFILMNGDILTTINYEKFYQFGLDQDAEFTIATKKIRTPLNFGSVRAEGNRIIQMEEKPDLVIEVVAGIYFMRPALLRYVPDGEYYGINQLIDRLLSEKRQVGRYEMSEYWLDIGQIDDYSQAEDAYEKYFRGEKVGSATE
jgi:NDP-sugar pyrophosphorylase family protein